MYEKLLSNLAQKYGRAVEIALPGGGDLAVSAFVQPLTYRNRAYMQGSHTPAGFDDRGYFLYIGPAEHVLRRFGKTGRITDSSGVKYRVQREELVYFKDRPCYRWAILKEVD